MLLCGCNSVVMLLLCDCLLQNQAKLEFAQEVVTLNGNFNMDLSMLLHGLVNVVSLICQSCYVNFRPVLNKSNMKFDLDFEAH